MSARTTETPDSGPPGSNAPGPSCGVILQALANDTRLAIVQVLLDGPRCVNQINAHLSIEKTLLSHHLRVLRETGIIERERSGKEIFYRLNPDVRSRRRDGGLDFGCCQLNFA